MDETKELLQVLLKNQELARARQESFEHTMLKAIEGINERLDKTNERLDKSNERFDQLADDFSYFKAETAENFKLLNLRLDENKHERRSEKRLLKGIESDLDKAMERIEKIEEYLKHQHQ